MVSQKLSDETKRELTRWFAIYCNPEQFDKFAAVIYDMGKVASEQSEQKRTK